MKRYIFNRVIQALVCIVIITIIVFSLTRISGDPVMLMVPPEATEEDVEKMREVLGLKEPIYVQYWRFISKAVKGDFGNSLRWNVPGIELFLDRFPNTLLLAISSMAFAVIIGIPVGIVSSVMVGKWFDNFGKIFALMGQALPVFWLGIMMMILLSVKLMLLPTSGMGTWKHLLMPTVTLGWYFTAALVRLTRSAMLDVLDAEHIKMARIMGVPGYMIVWKQALKNAFIPILTLGAVNFIFLLNGTVITETVFNWPGIGRLVVDAIFARDFPVVQMCVLIASCLYIFTNLLVDILYAYIDPRIRYT
jgi:peptide/nickel transport system permease protein